MSSEPSALEKSGERKTERDVGLFQERGEECIGVEAFLGCWLAMCAAHWSVLGAVKKGMVTYRNNNDKTRT